ncbi:fatty-acyl-CoA synthase [Prauserella shujinwangii]|uniref:Fatty-acyl-CoA synthase n=1 Tax=Prauserella shujinwangii TaxID=1453103 RepID=A0A2T0M3L6_9PSEU|nr:AMP-binding protein [Prauserella shujinwangii]PRX51327.1 fatty-acyl-CoA synthase [Prauserella shujinwangii]
MNLLSLLAGLAPSDPHAPIAIDVHPSKPVHVDRAELWRRTLQLRADLATAGVGRGDAVALWLPDWSCVLDWHIATASLGAHVVPLAAGADGEAVRAVLRLAGPKVVALPARDTGAAGPGALRDAVAAAGGPAPAVAVVAGPHDAPPLDPASHDVGGGAWLPSAPAAGMPMPATRGDELAVAFPVPAAGGPAFAAHRESAVVRHAQAYARALEAGDGDVVVCASPLSGAVGLGAALAALAGGATCLLAPGAGPGTLPGLLSRFAVTHVVADDETARRLADSWPERHRDPAAWRRLAVVGRHDRAAEATEAAERAEKETGVPATAGYCSPELLAPAALWPLDTAVPRRWQAGGAPVPPGLEVRVVDPVTRRPVPEGARGELWFRGDGVAAEHLGGDGARREPGGWLATGDLGALTGGELVHAGTAGSGKKRA